MRWPVEVLAMLKTDPESQLTWLGPVFAGKKVLKLDVYTASYFI